MINIFLLEDQAIVRLGLKKIFSSYDNLQIVEDFESPLKALKKLEEYQPDIILCDLALPEMSGFDFTLKVKQKFPQIKLAALTIYKDEASVLKAIDAGVDGYFYKDIQEKEMVEGIIKIYNNESYYCPQVAQIVIRNLVNKKNIPDKNQTAGLSSREIEVLRLIAEGLSNGQIAEKLFISPKTFDNHRANILRKLKLRNNVQLVKFAIENKLL